MLDVGEGAGVCGSWEHFSSEVEELHEEQVGDRQDDGNGAGNDGDDFRALHGWPLMMYFLTFCPNCDEMLLNWAK